MRLHFAATKSIRITINAARAQIKVACANKSKLYGIIYMLGPLSSALPYIFLHLPFRPSMKPFAHMSIFIPLTFSVAIKKLAKNLLVVLPRFAYLLQRQQKAINFTLYDYQFKINSQSHIPNLSEVFTLVSGQSGTKIYGLSSSRTEVSLSCHFVWPWVSL